MTLYTIIILALVQGITEFLPISSSGHLLLIHSVLDGEGSAELFKQNLLIDVAVHVGTLFSVLLYFRRDLCGMICSLKDNLTGKNDKEGARLNLYIILSSLPVIIAGFLMKHFDVYWGHAFTIVAWASLIFGIVLWIVDSLKPTTKTLTEMNFMHALIIGLAQAVALVPGTSRSGITMTAARFLGYSRTESAKYSLFLAIVAIAGAGTLSAIDLVEIGSFELTINALIAAGLSFVLGWITIILMMKWLEKASFKIFAIYRIIMGLALLSIGYFGLSPL